MSLQLVLGRSGSGKSYQLYKEIIDKSLKNDDSNYLIIVPEQFTLQTQKDIVSMHPCQGTMNIDILSFMRLAYRVFDEVGGNNQPVLEDTGKSMVLRKLVARNRKELELFNHEVQKQGFINELKSLMSEIYQYSIQPAILEEAAKKADNRPLLQSKLHDIITIYKAFREYLSEKYITAEEILDVLCEVIEKSQLIKNSIICLDGFTGFTPAQYKLLALLMKNAKKVIVTVTIEKEELDKPDYEFKLFHLSRKTMKHLMEVAEENGIVVDKPVFAEDLSKTQIPYRYLNHPALAALEANLFRYPYKPYKEDQDSIYIQAAKDKKQEVLFVIRKIKELVKEKNYRYQDMAVVTGDIAAYGREFHREFEKAGIPCFIDNKREVLSNPFVELLRSALDIIGNNFDYESVFRYLRCGMANLDMEDADILENYVLALGIRGRNKWQSEWKRTYRGQDAGELLRINEIREQICEEILPLYEVLSDKTKKVRDFTVALYEFGLKLEAPQKLEAFADAFKEQNYKSSAKEYEQIYGIVMELFEKLVELLGEEKLTVQEYIEVLEAGLMEAKVGLIPPGLDQIMVGDIERTRLKDIKALFFVGVNDTIIPKGTVKGGILTDMEREILLNNNLEMAPTSRQAAYTEKFYLYLNMTKPQEKLFLTFSKLSDEGKAVRPAYLIDTVLKLFPGIVIGDEDVLKDDLDYIIGTNDGLDYLIEGMRKYSDSELSDLWKELFSYYQESEDKREKVQRLLEAAFYVNKELGLSKKIARELYGDILVGSVTRFEKYAECAFAHYLNYGLELRERQEYQLAVPDIGNIFHNALELFSRKLSESQYNWHTIPEDIRDEWGSECVKEAADSYGNAIFASSKRYEYIVKRLERITRRTLWALSEQIKKGDFEPAGFELKFTGRNNLDSLLINLSEEESIRLEGRIDRLDICESEEEVFVKVVDYKSGSTSFDLLSLYYGLQIQLAVYMNAALELLEKEKKDKTVIPAGILYYNINDPFVEKGGDREENILRELKMNGIVNSNEEVIKHLDNGFGKAGDPIRPSVKSDIIPVETNKDGFPTKRSSIADLSHLKAMKEFVKGSIYRQGRKILDGNVEIKPYQLGKKSACDYCNYKSVCGFDSKLDGFFYHKLQEFPKDVIWDKIINHKKNNREGGDFNGMDNGTEESN